MREIGRERETVRYSEGDRGRERETVRYSEGDRER